MTTTKTRSKTDDAPAPDVQWRATQERLDKLKPHTSTFRICDDQEVKTRLAKARAVAAGARSALDALEPDADADADADARALATRRMDRAQGELEAAQAAYDQMAVVLRFKALERTKLEELQKQHPPTEKGEADGDAWDPDTFPAALISAASVDGMPTDYARHLLDTWGAGDAQALWRAAWSIQQSTRADLGKD